jgi:hypothetical protein
VKVGDLFRRDIHRKIEEVVKVDLGDEAVLIEELDEYVATGHIVMELEKVLDTYQESILAPNQSTNVWVSGFFGSGKSAWAKTLGYLLENPTIGDRTVADRFFERTHAPTLRALLNTIYAQAPTITVFLNLATGSNVVAREGESVVLPVYRALLRRLGYSSNVLLAELEWILENDGRLNEFEQHFAQVTGRPWNQRRYTALARNEASRALHSLDPATFPQPDSWALGAPDPVVDAHFVAARALQLLSRRGHGAKRIAFVVDEAGQYVARSVTRMLDLQGLAEACQVHLGRLWLIATSQERLNDVVDSLESTRIELARVRERFSIEVDLLPSDIEEVTSRRVLEKTELGTRSAREALSEHRHQLAANTRLASPTRAVEASEDELVRLYPLLPYQIQLLIDAVSARRAQGSASPTVGGSNRTLIKHAQALLVHPEYGLAESAVGALATLDRSYDLLEELIPTSWRAEIDQVAAKYGASSLEAKVAKVVALCADVRALPLNSANLAVLLHPDVAAESLQEQVVAALADLVSDDRVRETGDGYRLQSPEQKDWERERRGIDLTPGQAVRLRRELLRQALGGVSVTRGRAFAVALTVEGEKVSEGQLRLTIEEADADRRGELRATSREQAHADEVIWAFEAEPETWDALRELHRSRTIIGRRDTATKTAAEVELLGEERERARHGEKTALSVLSRNLATGQVIFRGQLEDFSGTDLRATAQKLLADRLDHIYPQLADFDANVRSADVLALLRADDLGGLPESLGDAGIRLLRLTPTGPEIATQEGPLAALAAEVRARSAYGQEATGTHLERHFAAPPYGARVEVVELLCAAGIRAGLLEAVHQGQRLANAGDRRLDQVFGTLPRFRAATFRLPAESEVSLQVRAELAERLEHLGGERPAGMGTDALARALRTTFAPLREVCVRVEAAIAGAGVLLPDVARRTSAIVSRLQSPDDVEVLTTAHGAWVDLVAGRTELQRLDDLVTSQLDVLRAAASEASRPASGLPEGFHAELSELRELLASGNLTDDFARITAISSRLLAARQAETQSAGVHLTEVVNQARLELRRQGEGIESTSLAEVLRPLEDLLPPSDLSGLNAEVLNARAERVSSKAAEAARQLDQLRSAGLLAWIEVSDLVADTIHDEDELKAALQRIEEAVTIELAAGKQVRLH